MEVLASNEGIYNHLASRAVWLDADKRIKKVYIAREGKVCSSIGR